LKDKNIVIKNISDLNKYKIGTTKDDAGEMFLLENGIDIKNLYRLDGTNSLATLLYKMEREKIDMVSYDTRVAMHSIDLNGFESDDYEVIYTFANKELFFAFNKNTDEEIIKKWQKALDVIKSNGVYDKIINKY
jgi:polar amino acid transport system substrate-binding protein